MEGVKDWTIDCLKETKSEGRKTVLRERMRSVKDWGVGRSREPKTGHDVDQGEARGRKSMTLRFVELTLVPTPRRPRWHGDGGYLLSCLGSVKVEECEVLAVDSSSP